eukprot:TRINITY_DN14181_c0_g1_i2.p1 TRINITY_DN14181_c0_g1~~TRINITY_DN14181_c0_g1_i2.p1  ORF type:complete len:188 (-),score=12.90 TRINITY_DN14181_c0_g1_i2:362-925(-)
MISIFTSLATILSSMTRKISNTRTLISSCNKWILRVHSTLNNLPLSAILACKTGCTFSQMGPLCGRDRSVKKELFWRNLSIESGRVRRERRCHIVSTPLLFFSKNELRLEWYWLNFWKKMAISVILIWLFAALKVRRLDCKMAFPKLDKIHNSLSFRWRCSKLLFFSIPSNKGVRLASVSEFLFTFK